MRWASLEDHSGMGGVDTAAFPLDRRLTNRRKWNADLMIYCDLRVTSCLGVIRYVVKREPFIHGFVISVRLADSLIVICSDFCSTRGAKRPIVTCAALTSRHVTEQSCSKLS
jgi:hypothetical protein